MLELEFMVGRLEFKRFMKVQDTSFIPQLY